MERTPPFGEYFPCEIKVEPDRQNDFPVDVYISDAWQEKRLLISIL